MNSSSIDTALPRPGTRADDAWPSFTAVRSQAAERVGNAWREGPRKSRKPASETTQAFVCATSRWGDSGFPGVFDSRSNALDCRARLAADATCNAFFGITFPATHDVWAKANHALRRCQYILPARRPRAHARCARFVHGRVQVIAGESVPPPRRTTRGFPHSQQRRDPWRERTRCGPGRARPARIVRVSARRCGCGRRQPIGRRVAADGFRNAPYKMREPARFTARVRMLGHRSCNRRMPVRDASGFSRRRRAVRRTRPASSAIRDRRRHRA